MRESNPAKDETEQTDDPATEGVYHAAGHARNLCLVWPDGKRAFFNYAYLISADFNPGNEMNLIKLGFSGQVVILKGFGLESLFMQLLDHLPKIIVMIDKRYIMNDEGSQVLEIIIEE